MPASTKKKRGSRPMWPDYRPQPQERTLALYDRGRIYTEDDKAFSCLAYNTLRNILFDENLLLFTDSFTAIPFLPFIDDIVQDFPNTQAHPNTLGSLGSNLQKLLWEGKRETTLSIHAENFIRAHMVGGRVDTPGLGNSYSSLIDLDMASAYLAHFRLFPGGTAIGFYGVPSTDYVSYFAECEITIRRDIVLGPFPKRLQSGRVSYPTLPGIYTAFLWKEQVEECEIQGLEVKIIMGYGFRKETRATERWCQHLYSLRKNAPTKDIEIQIKLATNASIGRHGMGNERFVLVPHGKQAPSDAVLCDDHNAFDIYIHPIVAPGSSHMYHFFSHCIAMTALTLYQFALPYAQADRLVASNYDCVLVLEQNADHQTYIKKHSAGDIAIPPENKTWRWQMLHNVEIRAPRRFHSDEHPIPTRPKTRQPV